MQEVNLGGVNSFIGAWILPDLALCDELIAYFKQRDDKMVGAVGYHGAVDKAIKDSVDLRITVQHHAHPAVAKYLDALRAVIEKYVERYEGAGAVENFGIVENINIQYYAPGGGYKQWHCERTGKAMPSVTRHLVFMTYLNDVNDEGGTEFFYQQVKTHPRKGLTLLWPADWTHHHRGVVSPTEEKYIITGWLNFL